ncbi:MAG: hypothetical protein JST36_04375 [Bacteroidetes bacterium]|nr:hypothetical protein [Bacteroidota bacterium]
MAGKRQVRIVLFMVAACVLVAAFVGIWQWNKPRRSVADVPAIRLSSDSLLHHFTTNEKQANALYLNKALEVSGTVQTVDTNEDGKTTVLFASPDPMSSVFCTLREKGLKVAEGKEIVIKGFCSGMTTDVVLTDCVLVNPANEE